MLFLPIGKLEKNNTYIAQKVFIVVVSAATAVSYDSTEIYREDDDDDNDEDDDEGAKRCFKLAINLVC